jgi:hypothetical protein
MVPRDKLVEIALWGVAGGATGAALAFLWRIGVQAEPVFALAGALIGTAGTVAGAVWVNDRNALAERRAEVRLLLGEYEPLLRKVREAEAALPSPDKAWPSEFAPALHALEQLCRSAEAISAEALQNGRMLNFSHRVHIRHVVNATGSFRSFHNIVFGEYEPDPMDERSWGSELDYLARMTADAIESLGSS